MDGAALIVQARRVTSVGHKSNVFWGRMETTVYVYKVQLVRGRGREPGRLVT